jgi:hypothetical protein
MIELWLRMTADAMHGTDQAQQAIKALGENPWSPATLSSWLSMWMPEAGVAGRSSSDPVSEFRSLLEQWYSLLGVVPLHQYQELRGRHEELTRRLQEAEATIGRLRTTLQLRGYEEEARGLLDTWERVTRQTLSAQADWAGRLMGGPGGEATPPQEANDDHESVGGAEGGLDGAESRDDEELDRDAAQDVGRVDEHGE